LQKRHNYQLFTNHTITVPSWPHENSVPPIGLSSLSVSQPQMQKYLMTTTRLVSRAAAIDSSSSLLSSTRV